MNRLKLIGHKWYVFFVAFKNVMTFIFNATDRIAGLKIIILTEEDLDNLDQELAEDEEDTGPIDTKDLN